MTMVERSFISLPSATAGRLPVGSNPCQGNWYRPRGRAPRTAFIATHYSADMSEHFLAEPLAARGYGFLGWNTRYRGVEDTFLLEHALIDIAAGMRWLRAQQHIERIVLLGNSGGGSLMAAYQSQATRPSLMPRASPLPDAVEHLPAGDLYISLNAHAGRPEYLTSIIDPSVTDENDPLATDPSLDMFRPENGPPYDPEFVRRYRNAQEARNRRITRWAIAELERLRSQGHTDRILSVCRVWADPRYLDPALDPSDRAPGMCYAGRPLQANRGAIGVARATTLTTWLSLWSLEHSQCRAGPHLQRIAVPALVVQSTHDVGVFPSDARAIYDALTVPDKKLVFTPGTHFFDAPHNAAGATVDLLVDWLREHDAY